LEFFSSLTSVGMSKKTRRWTLARPQRRTLARPHGIPTLARGNEKTFCTAFPRWCVGTRENLLHGIPTLVRGNEKILIYHLQSNYSTLNLKHS
jgi:hypothetical protein